MDTNELLKYATTFTLQRRGIYDGDPTETIMVDWRGPDRWVVSNEMGEVLNADDRWEYEPSPSNRTANFRARTRMTRDEAIAKVLRYIGNDTR